LKSIPEGVAIINQGEVLLFNSELIQMLGILASNASIPLQVGYFFFFIEID
jgi:hypothetical protein